MRPRKKRSVRQEPTGLEELRRKFKEWRQKRTKRGRVPAELVEEAQRFVGRYRASEVAKVLGLNYQQLKGSGYKRIGVGTENLSVEHAVDRSAGPSEPTFVKVPLNGWGRETGWGAERPGMVEFEDPRGFKARVLLGASARKLVCDLLNAIGGRSR